MKRIAFFIALAFLIFSLFSCHCMQKSSKKENEVSIPGPRVIIYKTKADYSKNIPIILSPDKKSVVSYPDIRDIKRDNQYTYPTQLMDGYLLDNRGITADVAFINLTYEQYSALPKTPNSQELLQMVIDKKPIKKMYTCGLKSKFTDLEQQLNDSIQNGNFSSFTRLK